MPLVMRMDLSSKQGAIWVGAECETGVPIAKLSSPASLAGKNFAPGEWASEDGGEPENNEHGGEWRRDYSKSAVMSSSRSSYDDSGLLLLTPGSITNDGGQSENRDR